MKLLKDGLCCSQRGGDASLPDSQPFPTNPGGELVRSWGPKCASADSPPPRAVVLVAPPWLKCVWGGAESVHSEQTTYNPLLLTLMGRIRTAEPTVGLQVTDNNIFSHGLPPTCLGLQEPSQLWHPWGVFTDHSGWQTSLACLSFRES